MNIGRNGRDRRNKAERGQKGRTYEGRNGKRN